MRLTAPVSLLQRHIGSPFPVHALTSIRLINSKITKTNININNAPYSSSPSPPFNPDTYLTSARQRMISQTPTTIRDILSPTPSHLLTLSLADHIPSLFPPDILSLPFLPSLHSHSQKQQQPPAASAPPLPQGYHLVYFPLQLPPSQLMPDGTDPAHWPGAPFERRMWAGGEVIFHEGWDQALRLDGRGVKCVEKVGYSESGEAGEGVVVKGGRGEEKVFVDVRRGYGVEEGGTAVEEVRRLVFMRSRGEGEGVVVGRAVRAPATPEFTFSLTPDATLLFHFSALTYNAHAIHLDPDYARRREGYRGLLVHGPLSLLLMLTAVRTCLAKVSSSSSLPYSSTNQDKQTTTAAGPAAYVKSLSYRNISPLYVGEKMTVCVKRKTNSVQPGQLGWDVWIEGPEGGLAVKGSAVTTAA
ncbi:hydroxyacyl-thioester dehydratase-like protein [Chaetomium sp. MPI-SDFR-AT-0129]|nr:hydroxyacyl-thioester dehydratase-like protein [Chaetomium sp. MPI-SDFR-AT-0129]